MGPVRILILVVALAAAAGAVVVVRGMSKAQAPQTVVAAAPPPVEAPKTQVLVAKRDLQPGTKLAAEDMTWQPWAKDALNAAFITTTPAPVSIGSAETSKAANAAMDLAKKAAGTQEPALLNLVGAVVREPILANEPMIAGKLVRAGQAGIMAITLETGMRAMAIPLSAESAAGGFILPGDHVDVVLTHPLEGQGKRFTSETVLKNVRILAIDQATATPKGGSSVVGATATVELNSKQAEVLALSKAQGELTLVLRSYADATGPAVTVAQMADTFRPAVVKIFKNGSATGSTTEVTVTR